MRIVFMGTPEFAVPSLRALIEAGHELVGVITQPDRPAGRGHKLCACPVKLEAQARGIPVYQFERVRREEGVACLSALAPDLVVTAAYGQILTQQLLDIPRYGTVNVHASLLPRHRGAAPINWCVVMGERVTGVTTMLTDKGMDTGDMLLRREVEIGPDESAGELSARLAELGARLLVETLEGYPFGGLKPVRQDETLASYEPMLKKEMGRVDWTRDAQAIACQVRGLNPWPCAYTQSPDGMLKLYRACARTADFEVEPGRVALSSERAGLVVGCGSGWLEITELQAPGGKRMNAKDYLRGKKIDPGTKFD